MANKTNTAKVNKVNNATSNTSNTTSNNTNAAAVALNLSAVEIIETAAALIKEYETISAIKGNAAAMREKYGPKTWDEILKQCKTIRAAEITKAAENVVANVFSYDGILRAVFPAVAQDPAFAALCKFAKREYNGTDETTAKRVISDYYTDVDGDGKPLARASWINAAGTEIYVTFEFRKLTDTAAVSILKTALLKMKAAAVNKVSNASDNATATRKNQRDTGKIIATYTAARDAAGKVFKGERTDTSKDERTKANAAAIIGKGLPAGAVLLSDYNKENGNTASE